MSKKDNAAAIPNGFEPTWNQAEVALIMFPLRFLVGHKAKTKLEVLKACTTKDNNSIRRGISRSFDDFYFFH
jgi:hypothetical protein